LKHADFDVMTIVGMLGLMFWLNKALRCWSSRSQPILLFFRGAFSKSDPRKRPDEVGGARATIVRWCRPVSSRYETVQALAGRRIETERLNAASRATVAAALGAGASRSASDRSSRHCFTL